MVRQIIASLSLKPHPWSDGGIKEAQKEDLGIKPILEFKESSSVRPSWQDISTYSSTAKLYWAQWNSLLAQNGMLYRKWESDDGRSLTWQFILAKSRILYVLKELRSSSTGGHFRVMKSLQKIRDIFYRSNLREGVEK